MKNFEIKIPGTSYAFDELPEADRRLVEEARRATFTSYVPYSHFHVGAAIQMADGKTFAGSNQENAAYPSGLCAERTTAYFASANDPGVAMNTIAIAARCPDNFPKGTPAEETFQRRPISPCGACRQALIEYEHAYGPIRVLLYGADEVYEFPSVASLLPYTFTDF